MGLGPSGASQLSRDDGVSGFGLKQVWFGMRRKLGPGLRRGDSFEVGALRVVVVMVNRAAKSDGGRAGCRRG